MYKNIRNENCKKFKEMFKLIYIYIIKKNCLQKIAKASKNL